MRVKMCKPQGRERIWLPSHNLSLWCATRGSVQHLSNKSGSAFTRLNAGVVLTEVT